MTLDIQKKLEGTKALTIPMQEIKVLANNRLSIGSREVTMTKTAFNDLLDVVGLTNKVVDNFNEKLENNAGYSIIKTLMAAMGTRKGQKVTLLIDEQTLSVNRVKLEGDNSATLTPSVLEDLISYAVDKSDGKLIIQNAYASDGGTKMNFNLAWDNHIPLTIKNENIVVGKTIHWDMLGDTKVGDYLQRLRCTNGMTGFTEGNLKSLEPGNPAEWYKLLFQDLNNPNEELIRKYDERVQEAFHTNLSVYEYNQIKSQLNIFDKDQQKVVRALGDERWRADYRAKGIDLDKATGMQLRNCPTPINAWDGINIITDLASHQYESNVTDRSRVELQTFAGKLLKKGWDARAHMLNIPTFNVSRPECNLN